jgi:hypothetical protein
LCKAYDQNHKLVWVTELLNELGEPEFFTSIDIAMDQAKKIFKKSGEQISQVICGSEENTGYKA